MYIYIPVWMRFVAKPWGTMFFWSTIWRRRKKPRPPTTPAPSIASTSDRRRRWRPLGVVDIGGGSVRFRVSTPFPVSTSLMLV